MTELCDIGRKYGTDKVPGIKHRFTPYYYEMFKDRRNEIKKVVEIGIGAPGVGNNGTTVGASLYMWRDFFPNAVIIGVDIDKNCMFEADRIRTYCYDQSNEEDLRRLIGHLGPDVDIFIDDGSHKYEDQIFTCNFLMERFDHNVTYIIEDVSRSGLKDEFPKYDATLYTPMPFKHKDDRLVVVKHKADWKKTLDYLVNKFKIDLTQKSPIIIPEVNRQIMAETWKELGFKKGLELGVLEGEHAETLCKYNPDLHLYCVDAWKHYKGYNDYMSARLEQYYQNTLKRLEPYNTTIIRKFSMDAVGDFVDDSLDFVYLDGGHDFKNVANDIVEWIKKVRNGGVLYGHDYRRTKGVRYQNQVKDVVDAYAYGFGLRPWFILGLKGKSDGLFKEGQQSWMFIKGAYAH